MVVVVAAVDVELVADNASARAEMLGKVIRTVEADVCIVVLLLALPWASAGAKRHANSAAAAPEV